MERVAGGCYGPLGVVALGRPTFQDTQLWPPGNPGQGKVAPALSIPSADRSYHLDLGQEVQGGRLLGRVGLGTGQTTHARSAGGPGADPPWLTPENVRSTFLFHSSREVGQSLRPCAGLETGALWSGHPFPDF